MAYAKVFSADLAGIVARTESRPGIRWGGPADRHALIAAGTTEVWLDWATNHGAQFVVAEDDGQLIGHVIYLTLEEVQQYEWLVVKVRAQQDVFSIGEFVIPERRGRNLIAAMKGFASRHFCELGYRRNVSVVDASNDASIKAHIKVGGIPIEAVRRVRAGKLVLVFHGRTLGCVRWDSKRPYTLVL